DVLPARFEDGEGAVRIVGGEDPGFGGHGRPEVDDEKPAAAGPFDGAEEAVVVLLVDDDVAGWVGAESVSPDAPGPARLVEGRVEDCAVVAGPGDAVVGAGNGFRMVLAGLEVPDAQHVVLVALGVER